MNFLAHIFLSGEDEKLMIGNFIGDYVKGNKFNDYPDLIKNGILLHRQIDSFTDSHEKFREAKRKLVPVYGLYSGIVVDLFYDHFLAKNWNSYSDLSLRKFTRRTHAILLSHFFYLPARVQRFLPFLIQNRRLESYANPVGIQNSLETMSRYTSLPDYSKTAIEILEENIEFYESNFSDFMSSMLFFIEKEQSIQIKSPVLDTRL